MIFVMMFLLSTLLWDFSFFAKRMICLVTGTARRARRHGRGDTGAALFLLQALWGGRQLKPSETARVPLLSQQKTC